jgi:hypothetical protein
MNEHAWTGMNKNGKKLYSIDLTRRRQAARLGPDLSPFSSSESASELILYMYESV